jgi:pimeloyl-ACP methyl ester carboxylesterase
MPHSSPHQTQEGILMKTVLSKDGTTIAFDRIGKRSPVILIGGALNTRCTDAQLAVLLAPQFTVFTYDRRGRGDSGDTAPYSVEREVDDLAALVEEAGGSAQVYGTSSGANLALEAAASGLAITRLALWEPNFLVDTSRLPLPEEYVSRLDELVSADRRGDAVEYFMTVAVGIPAEYVTPMRSMPMWPAMEAVAHTLAYDGTIVAGFALPAERVGAITIPTLVLSGGQTPWMSNGAQKLAETMPRARHGVLGGQPHNVAPDPVAAALSEFFDH